MLRLCISAGLRREAEKFLGCCYYPSQCPVLLCPSFPCRLAKSPRIRVALQGFCCTRRCCLIWFGAWSCHFGAWSCLSFSDWCHVVPIFADLPVLMNSPPTLSCVRRASAHASPLTCSEEFLPLQGVLRLAWHCMSDNLAVARPRGAAQEWLAMPLLARSAAACCGQRILCLYVQCFQMSFFGCRASSIFNVIEAL